MRFLFLYSELADYFLSCLRALVSEQPGIRCLVVHWPVNPEAPFQLNAIDGVEFVSFGREQSVDTIRHLCSEFDPNCVFASGWIDRRYLSLCSEFLKHVPVVCGLDTWWNGNLRQRLLTAIAGITVRRHFSHAWVAGRFQYEFARRLGFAESKILTGVYCADVERFHAAMEIRRKNESRSSEKILLYVGRIVEQKRIVPFYRMFRSLSEQERNEWRLYIRGAGNLSDQLTSSDKCDVGGFVQPHELPALAASVSGYVLPSSSEPWGVTIHEFAAAGLPILCSQQCGSASVFVQNGYNGCVFDARDPDSILKASLRFFNSSDESLKLMGQRSYELSRQNTPQLWVARLWSIVRQVD